MTTYVLENKKELHVSCLPVRFIYLLPCVGLKNAEASTSFGHDRSAYAIVNTEQPG